MKEVWLAPNRRAIWLGCVPPLMSLAVGVWLVFGKSIGDFLWLRIIGGALIIFGLAMIFLLLGQARIPRIAYEGGEVIFFLGTKEPIRVPLQVVEAFFLGQGPVKLPGARRPPQAVNLVARLAQRYPEWANRDVKHALGSWCDGYVTIRGTWCEPLNVELVRRLNRRLLELKTQMESNQSASP